MITTDGNGVSTPEPQDLSIRRRFLSIPTLLSFALAVAFIVFLFTKFDIDIKESWHTVRHVSPGLLILAFACYYLTFALRGYRWRLLLNNAGAFHRLNGRPPSVVVHVRMILIGWFANSVSWFKLGDAYRAFLMSSRLQVSFPLTMGTVVAERVLDLGMLLLLIVAAGVGLLRNNTSETAGVVVIMGTGVAALVGIALLLMRLFGVAIARLLPPSIRGAYGHFQQGIFGSFRQPPQIILISGMVWLLAVVRLYLVIQALNLDVSLTVIFLAALAPALLTGIPLTPGGLGFVEMGMSGLLVLAPTLEWDGAVVIALLDRTITYWSVLVVGGTVFAIHKVIAMRQPLSQQPAQRPTQAG